MTHTTILPALALDLAAISILAGVIYFRRHRRRDLLSAYVALNLGVFCAVTLLATQDVGVGLGFGLFGILSIVRLRSSSITQVEVGYYFIALTLGLVNGLAFGDPAVAGILNAALLAGLFVADHPRVAARVERRTVLLDRIHDDPVTLHADLERRLGGQVLRCEVTDMDYVQGTTRCDVRLRAPAGDAARTHVADPVPAGPSRYFTPTSRPGRGRPAPAGMVAIATADGNHAGRKESR